MSENTAETDPFAGFSGFSTTDGIESDGAQTEDEAAALEARAEVADAAKTKQDADDAAARKAAAESGEEVVDSVEVAEAAAAEEAARKADPAYRKSAQGRIDKAVERQRSAERATQAANDRATALEARIAALEGTKATPLTGTADVSTSDPNAPDPSKFEYGELDSKYIAAVVTYNVTKVTQAAKAEFETDRNAQAAALERAKVGQRIDTFNTAGKAKFDDYDEVVVEGAKAGEWPLTATVGELALESQFGHEIIYELASDPEAAKALEKKSPAAQAAWFGRQEALFEAKTTSQPAKPVKSSKAPPPPTRVRGGTGQQPAGAATVDFAAFEHMAMGR